MKRLSLYAAMMMLVAVVASCAKYDTSSFIGTWGVERIDYYNIDYNGDPIEYTTKTFYFTPGDMENGIDLVFRENQTGEMRDRSRDTIYMDWNDSLEVYETVIVCPDTTIVTPFTYSFDKDQSQLYMTLQPSMYTYKMEVKFTDSESFIYENNYRPYVVEKSWMRRYSKETRGTKSKPVAMPRHHGSLLSDH